jgi:hypothetical protein
MPTAEFHQLSPGISIWQNYDSSVKADLFSTAIQTTSGICLIDPIPLSELQFGQLFTSTPILGIVVTNANHQRSARAYSERLAAPIFAHADTFPEPGPPRLIQVTNTSGIEDAFEIIEIEGAVSGEIALYHPPNGGTLIVGDALINLEPYGFTFLPRKYCLNEKQMRSSLRKLLTRPAERLLFAHGSPILSDATKRLEQLLNGPA